MVHSVSGCTRGVQVKLWDPLTTCAIPECLRGVITTGRYTNPRLPLPSPYHRQNGQSMKNTTDHWKQSSTPACCDRRCVLAADDECCPRCAPESFHLLPCPSPETDSWHSCLCPSWDRRTDHAPLSAACYMPTRTYTSANWQPTAHWLIQNK